MGGGARAERDVRAAVHVRRVRELDLRGARGGEPVRAAATAAGLAASLPRARVSLYSRIVHRGRGRGRRQHGHCTDGAGLDRTRDRRHGVTGVLRVAGVFRVEEGAGGVTAKQAECSHIPRMVPRALPLAAVLACVSALSSAQEPRPTTMAHRSTVYAPHGIIATSQPLATAAGLAVLERGGNAIDAAVTAAAGRTVTERRWRGIGAALSATGGRQKDGNPSA